MREQDRRIGCLGPPLGAALSFLVAGVAHAQQAPAKAPAILEEIVVTAQKREQRLLDVPMSVSALTGEALERQGAATLLDVASTVPGLSTLEYAPGQNRVQLRGVSSATGGATVGQYLDEIPITVDSPQNGLDVRFIDLARVEVLRGPQGTLYGEGSMGGTIKYLTRDPELDAAAFGFEATYGSVTDGSDLYRVNAIANLPVTDTFGLRFAGGYERSPGWVDYPLLGREDVNEGESTTGRLKALWRPTEAFAVLATVMHQKSDYDSQVFADRARAAPYVALQPSVDETTLANLTLRYDAESFSVLSSSSFIDRSFDVTFDVTGFFGPIYTAPPPFGFGFPPGTIQSVLLPAVTDFEVRSQELRVASRGNSSLKWTVGVYYRDYEDVGVTESRTIPNPLPVEVLTNTLRRESKQTAVFGELAYAFTPRLEVTLGLRHFRDEREKTGSGANFGFPVPEPMRDGTFKSTNPRAVLAFRPDDEVLLYASAAKGFRSGGFNLIASRPPGCDLPDAYEPEQLWTYELGANVSLADGRAIVQSAVYRNEWKDIQSSLFCPGGQVTQTTNGGEASGTGVDLALTLRPLDALGVTIAAGYNDTTYQRTTAAQQAGDQVDFAPKFTASAAADYAFQWTREWAGRVHLDYQYTDDFSISLRNFAGSAPQAFSDPYGRLNARVSIARGPWEFALYGQNVTDTNKSVMPPIGVLVVPVSMQPRTFGVAVRYDY